MGQVAMPSDAKIHNRQMMLQVICKGGEITAAEIHQRTGISRPTVMRYLQHLRQKGIISSVGYGASTKAGGKKPEVFCFSDERKILCINLWPETITLALSSLIGGVAQVETYPHCYTGSVDQDLADAKTLAEGYLSRQGLSFRGLYGVALTVPGTVEYATNVLRYNSQAPEWGTDVPLEEKLRSLMGDHLVYYIDNAGKAAGRALLLEHPEYAKNRLITFFTTWGVSACLVEKGQVHNGRDSLIGEIGHMIISDTDCVVCGCGKRGCLESMVSIGSVRRRLQEMGESEGMCQALTIRQVFERSTQGDERAQNIAAYLAHCFAVALQNMSLAYNQEMVIFQGDFAWADETFDRCLKDELREFRYYPDGKLFDISYDRRNLEELAAQGSAGELMKGYFRALACE